jgi:hypothetical protein
VKVQVVNLEPEDDHISVREKLRWTKAPRVVFVWPGRGRVLTRLLDLKLLQRQAERQGTQIGLVTLDPDAIHNARELGIPVFETLGEIETGRWHVRPRTTAEAGTDGSAGAREDLLRNPPPRRQQRRALSARARYALFALGSTIPLIMLLSMLPSARLVVAPEIKPWEGEAVLQLTTDASENPDPHLLPIQSLAIRVSGSKRIPTTGSSSQPFARAAGEVQVTNISSSTLTLSQGTRLLPIEPSGPAFQTDSGAVIFPNDTQVVEITADEPGPDGNLPAGTIWAVEDPAGLSLDVVSPNPTSGGSMSTRNTVSAADRHALTQQLQAELLEEARSQMIDRLGEHERLIPESINLDQVAEATFDHEPGEIADSVALNSVLDVTGIAYDSEMLLEKLSQSVDSSLLRGWQLVPGSVKIQELRLAPQLAGSDADLLADYQASIYADPDRTSLIESLRLKPADQLERAFSASMIQAELISSSLKPAWLPFFPAFDFQYDVYLAWEQAR